MSNDTKTQSKELLPIGKDEESMKLVEDIGQMLMSFVCHGQKPFSKKLNDFVATGCHDIRAHLVAVDIIQKVQDYLDNQKKIK